MKRELPLPGLGVGPVAHSSRKVPGSAPGTINAMRFTPSGIRGRPGGPLLSEGPRLGAGENQWNELPVNGPTDKVDNGWAMGGGGIGWESQAPWWPPSGRGGGARGNASGRVARGLW